MGTQCRVTTSFWGADGNAMHIHKAICAKLEQMAIYRALKVSQARGGTSKIIA